MNKEEFKQRTKRFALQIIEFVQKLPISSITAIISRQLLRCGTSVGANYRAACRAKSKADFIAKMGIVEEEADETLYWFELLVEADIVQHEDVAHLMAEGDEILAIVVSSIRTARTKK